MNVAVDAAGQRQQAGRIDLARGPLDALGNAGNATLANADIGPEFVAGSHNGAAPDSEIELRHVNGLPIGSTRPAIERPGPNATILSGRHPQATSFATA